MIEKEPPVNFDIIEVMAEGDEDFKAELINALFNSIAELKEKYAEGKEKQDEEIISQIRHKVKPSLEMFEMNALIEAMKEGKDLLAENGFGPDFDVHFLEFLTSVQIVLDHVEPFLNQEEK